MRIVLFAIALFGLDAALFWGTRNLADEKNATRARLAEIDDRLRSSRARDEEDRRVRDLLERASSSMNQEAPDLASLRDLLIGAERGLDIDRLSLDFRSDDAGAGAARRGRVGVSLGGSFAAVHDYLKRVEALRLALVPEDVSLRRDEPGRVRIQAQWLVTWSPDAGARFEFSDVEVSRLEAWLARELEAAPGRDPFSHRGREREVEERVVEIAPPFEEPSLAAAPMLDQAPETPALVGFVIARPELESDVNRRVLAALRFEGELVLVGVGEQLGSFKVVRIDPRESVTLILLETGEPLTVPLE